MAEVVGEANVLPQEPSMGAEDFAFMLLEKPGAYCFIANGDGDHRAIGHGGGPCTLHNPSYDFNDQLIRSEEHTSEFQSPCNLVCRLLLEKKKHSDYSPSPQGTVPLCLVGRAEVA